MGTWEAALVGASGAIRFIPSLLTSSHQSSTLCLFNTCPREALKNARESSLRTFIPLFIHLFMDLFLCQIRRAIRKTKPIDHISVDITMIKSI